MGNEDKISEDAKKKREKEIQEEEQKATIKEFEKNWEDSRQGRVDSWLSFRGIEKHEKPPVKGAKGAASAPRLTVAAASGGGKVERKEKKGEEEAEQVLADRI